MTVRTFILCTCFFFILSHTTFSQSGYDVLVKNNLTGIKDSINHIDEFKDGFARIFDKKNRINYINLKGKKINPNGPVLGYSQESGSFPKKYFVFLSERTKYYGLLDSTGQVVLQPDYYAINFFGSYISLKKNKKAAVLDEQLKTVVDFEHDEIEGVNDAFIIVLPDGTVNEEERKRGVYSLHSKKMIIPLDNYMVIHALPWAFIVHKNGYEGLFDLSGKMIIAPDTYSRLAAESGGSKFLHGTSAKGHTVVDSAGKVIIPPGLYDDVWSYSKETDMFLAKKDGKWGVINIKNQVIIPMEYSELGGVTDPEGIFRATKDGETFFLSKKNYPLGDSKYRKRDGYRRYVNKDTTGYVDESGQIYPFPDYKIMGDYSKNGMPVCNRNKKWGVMSGDFKLVIDTVYDEVTDAYDGYYIVKKDFKAGVIDRLGKVHIPLSSNLISISGGHTFTVWNGDKKEIVAVKKIKQ